MFHRLRTHANAPTPTCDAHLAADRPGVVPYYVKALALGLPAYLIGVHLWTWVFMLPVFLGGRADFRQLYVGGYMLRSGHAHELYEYTAQKHFQDQLVSTAQIALPVNHLAYEELFFAPFSLMRYRTAYFAFLGFNTVLLAIAFRLLRPYMKNLGGIFHWLPAALFVGFLPVAAALMQGQDSILILTSLCGALVLLDRGDEGTAGALLASCLFKPQIMLPIAFLFLVWRRWRFVAGFALMAAPVISVSLWLVGAQQAAVYGRSLISMSLGLHSQIAQFMYGISPRMMMNLRGLIFGLLGTLLSNFWIQAITISMSVLVLFLVATLCPRNMASADRLVVAITTSTIVSYHLIFHDLSIMLVPVIYTLNRFIPAEAVQVSIGRRMLRLSALVFVAPVCISYIPDYLYIAALALCAFLYILVRHFPGGRRSTFLTGPAIGAT
jgi:hypothetical protein